MKSILNKKKAKTPFDYQSAENYKLTGSEEWTANNSYYFSAHDYQKKQSLYCRLGERTTHSEVWFVFVDGDKSYVLTDNFYKENSPLKVYKINDVWQVEFSGELTGNGGEKLNASFTGSFYSSAEPVDFFSHMATVRTAKAMAAEKWVKGYFDEVQKNNSVHYEQLGALSGELIVGEDKFAIDLPCVRDHSYGRRDWDYMNNHVWLMAVAEESYINFSMVSYPAMTMLEVGNYKQKEKPMAFMIKADYDRNEIVKGVVPEYLNMTFTLADKRKVDIKAKLLMQTAYPFQDGAYTLIEGVGEYEIDGKKYRGIIEVGFNRNEKRYFNGKSVKELKN